MTVNTPLPQRALCTGSWLLCRVTYQDTVFDSEEEIVPPTAEEGRQYAIQYQQLKKEMLGRTQRFGGLLAAYLFLTVSGQAGPCFESTAVHACQHRQNRHLCMLRTQTLTSAGTYVWVCELSANH